MKSSRLKALILSGNYFRDNLNLGDLAIYESLGRMLPESIEIQVLSSAPEAFSSSGDRFRAIRPPSTLARSKEELQSIWGEMVNGSEWVLASGGSYFSDLFREQTADVLNGLDAALDQGLSTAVLGATFEPLASGPLRNLAQSVLPNVGAIWTRDQESLPVLLDLGVAHDRITIIADPALRLCEDVEARGVADSIGVNLRNSRFYNPLPFELREAVRLGVRAFTRGTPTQVRSLPVSLFGPSDDEAVRDSLPEAVLERPTSVNALLHEISRCRVVLSGSHHSAVFALGLGIPVLMVAASRHYLRKLRSLTGHFGTLASVVDLTRGNAFSEIEVGLRQLWETGDDQRHRLRVTASQHVARGQTFVDCLATKSR